MTPLVLKASVLTSLIATLTFTGCASDNKKTAQGAGIGAGVGAVAGAIIGHQSGNREKGAVIGGLLGAGVGGLVGRRMDQQAKELEQIAETRRTDTGLVTKLKSDILFDTGKADLKGAAKTNLQQMGDIMRKYPENVLTIKGYTDSTGSATVNNALSQRRADAVRNELVAAGLPAATISTMGRGVADPIGDNKTSTGRKQNRRVDVEVTVDESKVPKK
ncbi:MAG: OmpA family protein [Bdellovibrionaceae bacterium]|nr:OmpA family protein [Bdellovibrio sp.]